MRPLTVLLGILMGSTASIAFGLSMVLVVFLILGHEYPQLGSERRALLSSIAVFVPLAALSIGAFIGDLKQRWWRGWAFTGVALGMAATIWVYWPK